MATEVKQAAREAAVEAEALRIAAELGRELQGERRRARRVVGPGSALDRDLGLDSLGRAELIRRLESAFGVSLPGETLGTAETMADLLRALAGAGAPASGEAGWARGAGGKAGAEPLVGPAEAAPDQTRTLPEVLGWHAARHPRRRHILFYPGDLDDGAPEELTYGELDRRASAVAAGLAGLGIESGQAVGLMLPSGLDYFAAFCGALYAGAVPVPLYPPARRSQIEDHLRRQAGILRTSEAAALVTFPEVLTVARLLGAQVPGLSRVATVAELSGAAAAAAAARAGADPGGSGSRPPVVRGEDVAFMQFTSGSTGRPKGVVLTHANLLANLRAIGEAVAIAPEDVVVSWLPLYHDMGLIGSWMASLYYGLPLVLMSPLSFLARPVRWLEALSRHRGTLSAAPNFAYELCARKIDEADLQGLDLSSWRCALNGAEPVSPEAIRRFGERFARCGFRSTAMLPVYGLAECSLALTIPIPGRGPVVDAVWREPLERSGRADPCAAPEGDPRALHFVGCGVPLPGHEVRVVGAAGHEAGEREEGRLQFRGPSATSGYFRDDEATRQLRDGDWLDSGDRAYAVGREIFITGRSKDIIIRAGRNLYPHELEEAVGQVPGVRRGCVAAFGSADPATGTERLVVVAETREREEAARERLREAVLEKTVDLLGAPADEVVLAPPHAVPKTSSGKVRRSACRDLYASGRLGRRGAALWWQLARLAWTGLRAQLGRRARLAGTLLYTAYAWLVFGLLGLPLWGAVALLPGRARRRRLLRGTARLMFRLAGIPLRVSGLERLAAAGAGAPGGGVRSGGGGGRPLVVASNHASYLDGVVLSAALPAELAFVVKGELEDHLLSRVLLRRVGALFVERFDASQVTGEVRKAVAALLSGESLIIFPEGTLRRSPGLLPFRMGAFLAAAEAGAAVVPAVIRGSRTVLRDEAWLFRRGAVEVTLAPAQRPDGADWSAALRLRDAVRAAILERCGEPGLRPDEASAADQQPG
ncbi:MAG TPA: AMP-binding protein [Thermoanaerobaculia bacterium]|nr:AMP-binding protein [Thermoanaerobaculia bacterium]